MRSAFIIDFSIYSADSICGRVRHVSSGEEIAFSSLDRLLGFFEEMNAVSNFEQELDELYPKVFPPLDEKSE